MGSCAEVFRYYVIWWKCSFHAYKVVDHLHIVKVWAQLIEQSPPYLPNLIAKTIYRLIEKWWLVVHDDYNTRKSTCFNIQMRSDTIMKPYYTLILTTDCSVMPMSAHGGYDRSTGVLTSPRHLIPPLVCPGVHVCHALIF